MGGQAAAQAVLEEIIVTAQKRSESLQDVSVAVSVMDGDKLQAADIASLEEMAFYIPSYDQSRTALSTEARIRGIGSSSNPGFEQSVGMFIDDIYMSRARQTVVPLFDLDRVEILKGPQSTLFGKNTIAGAVAIHTAQPTEANEGRLSVLYGTDGQAKGEAMWSGPLSDTLGLRLAGMTRTSDGYIDNQFNGDDGPQVDQWGVRGTLNWLPNAKTSVRIKLESAEDEVDGSPSILSLNTQIEGPGAPPLFSHLDEVPPHYVGVDDSDNFETDVGNVIDGQVRTFHTDTDFNNGLINIEYDLGGYLLTSITGYTDYKLKGIRDLDVSPVTLIGSDSGEDYEQWSQELRLTSPIGETFDYMAGIYLQRGEYSDGPNEVGFFTSNIGLPDLADGYRVYRFSQDTDAASAFVMGNWRFAEQFALKLGLRYSWEEKDMDKSVVLADATLRPLVPGDPADDLVLDVVWRGTQNAFPYETSQTRSETEWLPQVILEWYPNEDTMVYASASTGTKAGGWDAIHVNGDDLSTLEYEDESIESFEIGLKASLWDNRATINAAAFHSTIDDLQVSEYDGAVGFNVSNAAQATSQGVEMDMRVAITERLRAGVAITWLDYSYDEWPDAPCNQPQFNDHFLATGSRTGCTQDLEGEPTVQAPDWSGSLSASYLWSLPADLGLLLAVDANYRDDLYLAADLDPNTKQDSFWLLNAQLALTPADGRWQVAFIGKNLGDETVYSFEDDAPLGNGNVYGLADPVGSFVAITSPPRSYAVELTWYFQ